MGKKFCFYVDNSSSTDAYGSTISLYLNPPLYLDPNKEYQASVVEADITYCHPNITATNNLFKFIYPNKLGTHTTYSYQLEAGLYDLNELQAQMNLFIIKSLRNDANANCIQPYTAQPVQLAEQTANSKIQYIITDNNLMVDLSGGTNVFTQSLGFVALNHAITLDSATRYVLQQGNVLQESEVDAELNITTNYYLFCDFCSGSYLNNVSSNIIACITPTQGSSPYSMINFRPNNLTPAPVVRKTTIDYINFWLMVNIAQQGTEVPQQIPADFKNQGNDSVPEPFNFRVVIEEVS